MRKSDTNVLSFLSSFFPSFLYVFLPSTCVSLSLSLSLSCLPLNVCVCCLPQEATAEALQQVGPIVLLVSSCGILGFLSSAIIPIPALRAFVLQFAIILAVLTASLLLLFPAVVTLDLRRRRSNRLDFFCCFKVHVSDPRLRPAVSAAKSPQQSSGSASPSLNNRPKFGDDQVPPEKNSQQGTRGLSNFNKRCFAHSVMDQALERKSECPCFKTDEETEETDVEEHVGGRLEKQSLAHQQQRKSSGGASTSCFSMEGLIARLHGRLLQRKPVKVLVILMFVLLFAVCLSGIPKVRDGLELTDIVPRGTVEHRFLDVQRKYFSFYHMFAVTEGNFEYPTNQKLLYEYHHSFTRIGKIIKNDDGGLPDFWLPVFRDWLANLQSAYERDAAAGLISQEGWLKNASDDGILAFKLLVQTGRNDYPIDKSLVS